MAYVSWGCNIGISQTKQLNYSSEKPAEDQGFIVSTCNGIKDGFNAVTDATVGFVGDGYNVVADATVGLMKGAASCTKDVIGSVIDAIF